MDDAIQILNDLDTILALHGISNAELLSIIQKYVEQKRIECAPITNAKWKEI